jgi:hypothetical protein
MREDDGNTKPIRDTEAEGGRRKKGATMYDPMDRMTVVNRMRDERVADARREHLLRAAKVEQATPKPVRVHPSLVDRLAVAMRHVRISHHPAAHPTALR